MNIRILVVFFVLMGSFLWAQDQLKVEYEVKPFYESEEKMPNMVMIAKTSYFDLILSKDVSNWDYIERISNEQIEREPGMMYSVFEMKSFGTLHKNISNGVYIEGTEMDNVKYLINGELPKIDWKITRETKQILDFQVQKATAVLDDQYNTKVTAWYAPQLAFKNGPDKYWGLPGLILEIETEIAHESGSREGASYKAVKLSVLKSNKAIKEPTKGEGVTEEEFKQIQEERMAKMMEMFKSEAVDKD